MPGSGSDQPQQEQDTRNTENNPATNPATSEGFDEVLSLFKTYLETRLEQFRTSLMGLSVRVEVQLNLYEVI